MLKKALIVGAAIFAATAAAAQTVGDNYLIFPTMAACQARSQTQCVALGCDGVYTVYWWNCLPLKAGTVGPTAVPAGAGAVEIQPSGPFAATTSNIHATNSGLSSSEQSNEVTANAIAPVVNAAAVP